MFVVAIFLAILAFSARNAGFNLSIERGVISLEMKLAFFEMSFDFGQSRSKTNSLMVILG